jgi:hypothetical protein
MRALTAPTMCLAAFASSRHLVAATELNVGNMQIKRTLRWLGPVKSAAM